MQVASGVTSRCEGPSLKALHRGDTKSLLMAGAQAASCTARALLD